LGFEAVLNYGKFDGFQERAYLEFFTSFKLQTTSHKPQAVNASNDVSDL
jgi:hypothetical protein